MRPHHLAYACFAVPLLATHAAWLIHLHAGAIPACNPYLEGCVSISRAVRSGDGLLLFRGLMLPWSALLALFWLLVPGWLRARAGRTPRRAQAAAALGVIAAAFVAIYVDFLGEDGRTAQLMRRYGINVFFGFTVLAQMLLASVAEAAGIPRTIRRCMLALLGLMLVLGIASIPLQHFVADRDTVVNVIEWAYALLMICVFALIGRVWQHQKLALRLSLPGAGP